MSLLRAERLTKSYNGRVVVRELTLEVRSGEIIGLLGRNGAGKTTTFQMMVGLVRPESGIILLDGADISRMTTYRRAVNGITYLPQEGSVFLKASVEDNLNLVLELQPGTRQERQDDRPRAPRRPGPRSTWPVSPPTASPAANGGGSRSPGPSSSTRSSSSSTSRSPGSTP